MSTPVPRSRRRLRASSPGAAAPRQPVDQAKIGRCSVRRRATGMTAAEAATALEEARLQRHLERDREDLTDDPRGPAKSASGSASPSCSPPPAASTTRRPTPSSKTSATPPPKANARSSCRRGSIARRREPEPPTAPPSPRTSCATPCWAPRTGLLDSLSEDERAAVGRLPESDPAAALAFNALLARAHEAGTAARASIASSQGARRS
ncbi:hypothetical protein [Streptomyces puniciscabiei]|uniref:hypothetical protein n=1 Tax=Streptomyces puniciscabiei TaxID=164348 RepID=UPI003333BD3B